MFRYVLSLFFLLIVLSCNKSINYEELSTFHEGNVVNAVIEIPAGKNKKIEYNKDLKKFLPDSVADKERIIDFLPYPGNYGFIPSTLAEFEDGGDGDALDILIISQGLDTGEIQPADPIGVLKLLDNGEKDYKIIAIPSDKKERIITASTFREFQHKYPEIIQILEVWFLNYNKEDEATVLGWGNEKEALSIINKNRL